MATPAKRDHTAEAYERLSHQFKDKPNLVALLAIFTAHYDELEAAFYALLVERTIYAAVGAQLDQIGAVVGQPRQGLDDETYRRYILARIAANKSDGLVEDLLNIVRLILNDDAQTTQVISQGIASAIVRVTGDRVEWATAMIVIELLRSSVAGGVRALLEFMTFPAVTITKTGGLAATFDAGASSIETIAGDGYIEFSGLKNSYRIIGFSTNDPGVTRDEIDYGIYLRNDSIGVTFFANGVSEEDMNEDYVLTDVFKLERVGNTVKAYKNKVLVHTYNQPSTGALLVDTSFFNDPATASSIVDIRLYDAGKRKLITWQNVVNVSISPQNPPTAFSGRFRFSDATIYAAGAGGYPQNATELKTAMGGHGTWTGATGWLFDGNTISANLAPIFGSPTFATGDATIYVGSPGPRGGTDKFTSFDNDNDGYAGGVGDFDVGATDDLMGVLVFRVPAYDKADIIPFFNKNPFNGTLASWQVDINGNRQFRLTVNESDADGDTLVQPVTSAVPINEWCAAVFVLDRTGAVTGVAIESLATRVQVISSLLSTSSLGSLANAGNFRLCDSSIFSTRLDVAAAYIVKGNAIAGTLANNLSPALTSFCNKITSYPYTLPDYGSGFEDANDKYPMSLNGLKGQLLWGIDGSNPVIASNFTWYNCNETSGNLVKAFGGGPVLTAAGTPLYSIPGPRGGNDKMVSVDANADQWTGGNVFNVGATDGLFALWVGRIGATPGSDQFLCVKGNSGSSRWGIYISSSTNQLRMELVSASGTLLPNVTISSIYGKMHVGAAVIDRSTQKARICIRTLDGVEVMSTEVTTFAETHSNADNFTLLNRNAGGNFGGQIQLAGFGIATGANEARGMSANLSAIVSRFATAMNRYYGGNFPAAME